MNCQELTFSVNYCHSTILQNSPTHAISVNWIYSCGNFQLGNKELLKGLIQSQGINLEDEFNGSIQSIYSEYLLIGCHGCHKKKRSPNIEV